MPGTASIMDAPLQTLAPELLCKIFRLAAMETYEKVALSAVCAHWRACVLADASWWADLMGSNMHRRLFELALARSQGAPLSVSLESEFLPLIEPHAQRIRRLAFFVPDAPPAFIQAGSELSALQFLSMKNAGWRSGVSLPSLCFRAPRLETLHLYGIVVHQWNDMDVPALRDFAYIPGITMDRLDEGVPVTLILNRLLSMCTQIRTIKIRGRCRVLNSDDPIESSPYGQLMEELQLFLCCSACGMRVLAAFPRTVERLRVLRVQVSMASLNFDVGAHHDELDEQGLSLVMALASGHRYTALQLAEEYIYTLSATFTKASRTVHVTLPRSIFLLDWPPEWRSLRLSDTLQSITLPLGLWPEFALLTQGQPLMAPSVHICVLARLWNDLSQPLDVAHCPLLGCLELCLPGARKDGASSFRMQPILQLTSAVVCTSNRVKLVLERSDDPSADASLEERLLSALDAKRVAHSGSQPEWTIEWKE